MKVKKTRKYKSAIVLVAACAIFHWATAQNSLKNTLDSACPKASEVRATDLYGAWRVELTHSSLSGVGATDSASVIFEKNPEFSDSVVGWLQWGKDKIFVAGDVDEGSFSLEESDDGTRISAVWEGNVAQGSCGKAITGTRRVGDVSTPFVLRKSTGWN